MNDDIWKNRYENTESDTSREPQSVAAPDVASVESAPMIAPLDPWTAGSGNGSGAGDPETAPRRPSWRWEGVSPQPAPSPNPPNATPPPQSVLHDDSRMQALATYRFAQPGSSPQDASPASATGRVGPMPQQGRTPAADSAVAGARQAIQHQVIDPRRQKQTLVAEMGWQGFINKRSLRLPAKNPETGRWEVRSFHTKISPGGYESERIAVKNRIGVQKSEFQAIAVMVPCGGVGKTTISTTLGSVFAVNRPGDVVVVDADPASAGQLALRTATHPHGLSKTELLANRDVSQSGYVEHYMSRNSSNLWVLDNGWSPAASAVFGEYDISDIRTVLSQHFGVVVFDCGDDLHTPVMRETLSQSDAVVIVVEISDRGVAAAASAIDVLRAHGHHQLLHRTMLVGNAREKDMSGRWDEMRKALIKQKLKIHYLPYDSHLHTGVLIDLAKISPSTRVAYEDMAASLADDFYRPQEHFPDVAAMPSR